ncbi:MAG: toxin-antitoxin system YwqK family antitoxin [Cyclobacteriaceae bacterium]|nr:toxin-antitoxin system YwqK family antitoxin [Cyclobacteriaceae bacterium]
MKKSLLMLIPLVVSCEFIGANKQATNQPESTGGKTNGVVKANYPDGSLRAEIIYKDGIKHGQAKEYYKTGKLFQAIDYVNGVKHGWAKRYWENGQLYQETPYDSGKINGEQKKYREDGKLSTVAPYYMDNPCTGLKEYLLDGKLKTDYPKIVITPIDNLWKENQYTLRLTMSDKSKGVEYFTGKLTDGKYIGDQASKIWNTDRNGVGELTINLPPGGFMMEELNIIAKVKTIQGNYYVTQRKHNLAIQNRR